MNTKLIVVEGIPGSGKTTTANFIKELLDERNISNQLFLEGDLNHPADFESVACLDETE
jgi:thymidylate kinase